MDFAKVKWKIEYLEYIVTLIQTLPPKETKK